MPGEASFERIWKTKVFGAIVAKVVFGYPMSWLNRKWKIEVESDSQEESENPKRMSQSV